MTDTLSSIEEDNNQPEAMDPAKEDMADLSLSKLTPPPPLPPGTNGENEPISAASNNPNGKEEEEKDLRGATEMKGEFHQSWTLLITMYIAALPNRIHTCQEGERDLPCTICAHHLERKEIPFSLYVSLSFSLLLSLLSMLSLILVFNVSFLCLLCLV